MPHENVTRDEVSEQVPGTPPGLSRRAFLGVGSAALAGMALGPVLSACGAPEPGPPAGGAAKPAAKEAPAVFKGGGSLAILLRAHFIPAYDKWLDQFAKDWGKKNNVDVTIDNMISRDLPEKVAAEVAAQAGHDIIGLTQAGAAHLYADHLVDVSDLANDAGAKHGGWIPQAELLGKVGGIWTGVPDYFVQQPCLYRIDLFAEAGFKPPDTWEELLKAGTVLKQKGYPIGIQVSQKSNDANTTWNGVLWSYGASYVAKDGKTVAINSPETREALKLAVELYNKTMTNEVLSWDDASNNRYIASGKGSWVQNAISALRTIEKDNPDLAKKIGVTKIPAGPKGRFVASPTNLFGIAKWSKNAPAAKAFLAEYYANFLVAFKASEGYNHPLLRNFLKQPMPVLGDDPKYAVVQDSQDWTYFAGYPGPVNAASGEVDTNWIIPLMITRAVTSGNVEDAIGWCEQRLKAIYARHA